MSELIISFAFQWLLQDPDKFFEDLIDRQIKELGKARPSEIGSLVAMHNAETEVYEMLCKNLK